MSEKLAIKIKGLKKRYRLGQIGGGTLTADLQSWWARLRGKEDPNSKIGTDQRLIGTTFMALNGIDLEVKQGEALGIIGGNGAGKSTMLKILSRITAPTEGTVDIYGRIASMLEVGTGFSRDLTGRENVYMNGAILGMTKAEIDAKMEDIINFSEVREFIDTPVKRYSSGMYVKLAFSVAAHLDAEIMIMDEVLAVGDMDFQQKCLDKMRDAATLEGKTVLYVSHNMNTIRKLCHRCVVLDKGRIVFDGDVEQAIGVYLGLHNAASADIDLSALPRMARFAQRKASMVRLETQSAGAVYDMNAKMPMTLTVESTVDASDVLVGVFIHHQGMAVTSMKTPPLIRLKKDERTVIRLEVDLERIAPAGYTTKLVLARQNGLGMVEYLDVLNDSYAFEIKQAEDFMHNQKWVPQANGFLTGAQVELVDCSYEK